MMENWMERYKLNECLIILSMLLAFIILAVFGQRKTWIATDSVMMCISGTAFVIFPRQILSLETHGSLGNMEIDIARFFGLTVLCSGLLWLKIKETRDGTVIIAILQSRVFVSLILVIVQSFVYFGSKNHPLSKKDISKGVKPLEWSDQMFFLGIFPTFIWFLGNILHLIRSYDFNSFPQHNICLNNHLKIEAMLIFALGVALISFPSQILQYIFKSNGNKVALHIVRSIGSVNIGSGIMALQAPGFLHERDKKAIFLVRMLTCLLQLGYWCVLILARQLKDYNVVFIFLPIFGNAIIGYFWGGTNIYTPSVVRKSGNDSNDKNVLKAD